MNNLTNQDFRKELLRTDIVPRKLNDISKKYKELLLLDIENNKIKLEEVSKCQCGSSKLEQLTKIDRFGLPFGSLICQNCGLVLTSPRICNESLPYYYDKYYHSLNYGKEHLENQTVLFASGQGKKIFNILKDFLPKKKKLNVLEIGAGTGNVLNEFKLEAKKENITINELGTEYSNDCIEKCKSNGINVMFGNIQTVIDIGKKFDVIILSHIFEHFIDLNKELSDLKKLITKNSLLYIEVPGLLVNHKKYYYNFSFLGYLVHAHMYNFSLESLKNILTVNDFEAIFGNEEVEAVYRLGNKNNKSTINSYIKNLNYLEFLFNNENYFIENYNEKIDKYESMIKYRNNDIAKLSEQVGNRKEDIVKLSEQVENRDESIKTYEHKLENRKEDIVKLSEQVENRDESIKVYEEKIKEQKLIIKEIELFLSEKNIFRKYSIYRAISNKGKIDDK